MEMDLPVHSWAPTKYWVGLVEPGSQTRIEPGGSWTSPYAGLQPGFLPFAFPAVGGRPEPGNPLYTSPADGPELRLIAFQLAGSDHYTAWARDFRRAFVTKDPFRPTNKCSEIGANAISSSALGLGIA